METGRGEICIIIERVCEQRENELKHREEKYKVELGEGGESGEERKRDRILTHRQTNREINTDQRRREEDGMKTGK